MEVFHLARFSISPNKTIIDPSGKRFIVKGVTMFDYLFVSYESRADYSYRAIGFDVGKNPCSGISEPTYFARVSYIDDSFIVATLLQAKNYGINLIRVAVEPAMIKASVAYTDPSDGLTYPSDMDMLDTIITKATELGIVVQLQNGNDKVPLSLSLDFVKFLAHRYSTNAYVWINPANELNGSNGSGNVNNITVWHSTMSQYITALRSTFTDGTKFLNPVVINPPQYGENLVGIASTLNAYPVYSADTCLFIGIHLYPQKGQWDFTTCRLPAETLNWFQFINQYCIFIDEVGLNNYSTSYDPDLNPGYSSADTSEWARMQSWGIDFCNWVYQQCNYGKLNGATGISWYAYIPGMQIVDLNSMIKHDGTRSHWGEIFTSHTSRPDVVATPPKDEVWNSYIPSVFAHAGVITSYTAKGRFYRLNSKTLMVQITISIPNNGTGITCFYVTLPPTEATPVGASQSLSGMQIVNDYSLTVRLSEGLTTLKVKKYDGTYPVPSGAQYIISGFYEIA
jgi:hypothetical protein